MKQNKLSLESENLVIDSISFNIKACTDPVLIGNYLSD
jgi:hypothetical protein